MFPVNKFRLVFSFNKYYKYAKIQYNIINHIPN